MTPVPRPLIDVLTGYGGDEADDPVETAAFAFTDEGSRWTAHGFGPATAREWIDRERFDPETAARWRDAGFGASAAESWADFHDFSPTAARAWSDEGFDATQAADWESATGSVEKCREWRTVGVSTASEAAAWRSRGLDPVDAADWVGSGFVPSGHDVWRLWEPGVAATWRDAGVSPDGELPSDWAFSGISPHVASEWINNGYSDLAEQRRWVAANVNPEQAKLWSDYGYEPDAVHDYVAYGYEHPDQVQEDADVDESCR